MSATTTTTARASIPRDIDTVTTLVGDGDVLSGALRGGALLATDEPGQYNSQITTDNPVWWPTQHRRIPNYRQARYHPQWNTLTDSSREAFMIDMMFRGCYLLSVGESIFPRQA